MAGRIAPRIARHARRPADGGLNKSPVKAHTPGGQALGFEIEYRRTDDAAVLVGLRLDGNRLLLATPGALGIVSPSPTTDATVILMHPDVGAHRRALGARFEGALGPVRAMGDGAFYELRDPSGNRVWIMQVD